MVVELVKKKGRSGVTKGEWGGGKYIGDGDGGGGMGGRMYNEGKGRV